MFIYLERTNLTVVIRLRSFLRVLRVCAIQFSLVCTSVLLFLLVFLELSKSMTTETAQDLSSCIRPLKPAKDEVWWDDYVRAPTLKGLGFI